MPEPEARRTSFAREVHVHESSLRSYLRAVYPSVRDVDDVVQEASGWEIELQASPTENVSFAIGYARPKVEFSNNPINPAVVGAASAGVFESTINAVARYSVIRGPPKGAYAGTSFQYRGAWRESNNFGGVFLPSYMVWNPFLGYDWKPGERWHAGLRLDVRNALDKAYVTRNIVGEPLSVFFSAQLRFK
jgi:outer membrane receptor protein involved in Fe transport